MGFQRYFRKMAIWSTLAITFFFMLRRAAQGEYLDGLQAFIDFVVLFTYSILIWQFNFWLDDKERLFQFFHVKQSQRLLVQSLASLLVGILVVAIVETIVHITIKEEQAPISYFIFRGVLITIILQILFYAVHSVYQMQLVEVKNAQLLEMNAKAQMELLRQQVNPHFLFNALNTLKTLVKNGDPNAQNFIVQLADVYRYLLQTNQKEKVTLQEDLSIAQSYAHLMHARFEDNFQLLLDLPEDVLSTFIPPNTFQLLIENAIKHNAIGTGRALKIKIFWAEDFVVVENNRQPKRTSENNTGLGLENIRQRYLLIRNLEIKIVEDEKTFAVYLPIIRE